mmetsp:Transcript_7292/g.13154  ORF Transcript_7292/g.13154 Transcript_7292/m.13154 type:complete len:145 (-) Transcript_7292:77-511(-)
MASNINVADDVVETFEKLVHGAKYRAVVGKINDSFSEIEVERTLPPLEEGGDLLAAWKEMVESLPENDCRFVLYDFQWKFSETITKSKVILILWSAEYSKVRNKMIYASSKECLTNKIPEINRFIQATETDELTFDLVLNRIEH